MLCFDCRAFGYCRNRFSPILTDEEIDYPPTIRGIRKTIYAKRVRSIDLLEYVTDLNRDFMGRYFDPSRFINPRTGRFVERFVDMRPLEHAPLEWWRDFCNRPPRPGAPLHVRCEARERVRSLGAILRASFPGEAANWILPIPANDNHPPEIE